MPHATSDETFRVEEMEGKTGTTKTRAKHTFVRRNGTRFDDSNSNSERRRRTNREQVAATAARWRRPRTKSSTINTTSSPTSSNGTNGGGDDDDEGVPDIGLGWVWDRIGFCCSLLGRNTAA